MRTRWIGLIGVVTVLGLALPAAADVPDSFTACVAPDATSDLCERSTTYLAGSTLILRGEVSPPHADLKAKVFLRSPYGGTWEKVDRIPISDVGKMTWTWTTDASDASPDAWKARFRICNHGRSNAVSVMLVLGE